MLSNITFKHRLIGGIFLVSLAVIIIPALFDTPRVDDVSSVQSPDAPLQAAWEELDKIEYTFSELAQSEEEVLSPGSSELAHESVTMSTETTEVLPETSTELAHGTISAPTPPPPEHPTPVPHPEPAPKAVEPTVVAATERLISAEGWAVQLGAFSKKENAQALAKRLEDKGYQVFLDEITASKLTRVLVGTKENKQQASELMTELDKNMQLKGILVKFDPKG